MNTAISWHIGEKPLVFSGTPPLLSGEIELINEGDEKIAPKRLEMHFDREQGIHADLRVPGRFAANSRTRVRAQFVVDRDTLPGTYHGSVSRGQPNDARDRTRLRTQSYHGFAEHSPVRRRSRRSRRASRFAHKQW